MSTNQDSDRNNLGEGDTPGEERDELAELYGDETQDYEEEDVEDAEDLFGDDMER